MNRTRSVAVRAALTAALVTVVACSGEPPPEETEAPPPVATDPAALVGSWRVTSISMEGGEGVVPAADAVPMLDFTDEAEPTGSRAFGGSGGCNRIRGSYDAGSTGRISFGATASTMMACPEPAMAVEQALLGALEAARSYTLDGERLEIGFAGGTIHLERSGS